MPVQNSIVNVHIFDSDFYEQLLIRGEDSDVLVAPLPLLPPEALSVSRKKYITHWRCLYNYMRGSTIARWSFRNCLGITEGNISSYAIASVPFVCIYGCATWSHDGTPSECYITFGLRNFPARIACMQMCVVYECMLIIPTVCETENTFMCLLAAAENTLKWYLVSIIEIV